MEKKELRFRQDGTFKVMQLTDIHYTDDDATITAASGRSAGGLPRRSRIW